MELDVYSLLSETNAIVGLNSRWAEYCKDEGWTVYERKPYARRLNVIIQTMNESDAMKALAGDMTE